MPLPVTLGAEIPSTNSPTLSFARELEGEKSPVPGKHSLILSPYPVFKKGCVTSSHFSGDWLSFLSLLASTALFSLFSPPCFSLLLGMPCVFILSHSEIVSPVHLLSPSRELAQKKSADRCFSGSFRQVPRAQTDAWRPDSSVTHTPDLLAVLLCHGHDTHVRRSCARHRGRWL